MPILGKPRSAISFLDPQEFLSERAVQRLRLEHSSHVANGKGSPETGLHPQACSTVRRSAAPRRMPQDGPSISKNRLLGHRPGRGSRGLGYERRSSQLKAWIIDAVPVFSGPQKTSPEVAPRLPGASRDVGCTWAWRKEWRTVVRESSGITPHP